MDFLNQYSNVPPISGTGANPMLAGFMAGLMGPANTRLRGSPGFSAGDPMLQQLIALQQMNLLLMSTLLQQMNLLLMSTLLQLMMGGQGNAGALAGLAGLGTTGGVGASGSGGGGGASGASGGGGPIAQYDPNAGGSNVARPNGLNGITQAFGQPGDRSNLVSVQMPAGPGGKMMNVTVHKLVAGKLKAAFEEIKAAGLSDEIKSFDGSFNDRAKRGGSSKSTHAWGIAIDINAGQYPMGTSASSTSPRFKQIAAIFAKYGFHQLDNDPMHFQYATGY